MIQFSLILIDKMIFLNILVYYVKYLLFNKCDLTEKIDGLVDLKFTFFLFLNNPQRCARFRGNSFGREDGWDCSLEVYSLYFFF